MSLWWYFYCFITVVLPTISVLTCSFECACTPTHPPTHTHTHTLTHTLAHSHTRTLARSHTRTLTHLYSHTHTYTYMLSSGIYCAFHKMNFHNRTTWIHIYVIVNVYVYVCIHGLFLYYVKMQCSIDCHVQRKKVHSARISLGPLIGLVKNTDGRIGKVIVVLLDRRSNGKRNAWAKEQM